ncbi:MAG: hypothetical protein ACYCXT_03995 [Acidiferrobacteraceae bacterium]
MTWPRKERARRTVWVFVVLFDRRRCYVGFSQAPRSRLRLIRKLGGAEWGIVLLERVSIYQDCEGLFRVWRWQWRAWLAGWQPLLCPLSDALERVWAPLWENAAGRREATQLHWPFRESRVRYWWRSVVAWYRLRQLQHGLWVINDRGVWCYQGAGWRSWWRRRRIRPPA